DFAAPGGALVAAAGGPRSYAEVNAVVERLGLPRGGACSTCAAARDATPSPWPARLPGRRAGPEPAPAGPGGRPGRRPGPAGGAGAGRAAAGGASRRPA